MKNIVIVGIMSFTGAALANSVSHANALPEPTVLLAHAGHDHGTPSHAKQAVADNAANAKVSSTLVVSGCWIRSLPLPAPSGGYFVIENSGSKEAKLQSASSTAYGMVMLHQTTHQGGMSRMSATHDIAIPAGGKLEFKPGGYHAMLENPANVPAIGSKVKMDFVFDSGEKASADCEIKAPNTQAPMSH
ncbi:copper chaperone PCu(A)C [Candidimonas sp. SYP-B2681]|uniref:copper chaperone PCu(A)C n=1 Tax=Candidimonas sp. SYP-B2681 TaxID=2497686 RepID=UPI0013153F68|nr:copper chaperone PCu(A)C [Candidimonas sp. SYP-B2681]